MTPVNPTTNNAFYVVANGTTQSDPFINIYSLRDPTSNDVNFPIQKRWINFTSLTTPREWILERFSNTTGQLQAVWVLLAEGGTGILSLSDDVGTKVFPDGTGNIQLEGQLNEQVAFFQTVTANPGSNLLTLNPMSPARWIVDPLSTAAHPNGTHTTISSAIASASPGDTILVMPGTYTENPTITAGLNITGLPADDMNPQITIIGKVTFSAAGSATLSNLTIQTNSDFALVVSGSAASVLNCNNVIINATNHTGINFTSSSAAATISLISCNVNVSTSGITAFTHSSAGSIFILLCGFGNATSTTASTASSGGLFINFTGFNLPLNISGTAVFSAIYSNFSSGNPSLNFTNITTSTSANCTATSCIFGSGTASALVVNTSTTFSLMFCQISSSNTDAITGTGRVIIEALGFVQSFTINASSQGLGLFNPGIYLASSGSNQIAGAATLTSGTVIVSNLIVAANDMILLTRTAANASSALGALTYTISAGASFTVTSLIPGTPGSTQTGDASSFNYLIVRKA